MKTLSLKTTRRKVVGKGAARSLRRMGFIPAVLYGPNLDPVSLSVELLDILSVFRASGTSQFLLNLNLDGEEKKVTIKDLQTRPVTGDILHVDFYEVAMDRKIRVSVPISTYGKSKGVELGGMLQIIRREIEVLCLPGNIPNSISVDVSKLDVGDSLHVMDLSIEDDIETVEDPSSTVLTILSQKILEETSDEKLEDKVLDSNESDIN